MGYLIFSFRKPTHEMQNELYLRPRRKDCFRNLLALFSDVVESRDYFSVFVVKVESFKTSIM